MASQLDGRLILAREAITSAILYTQALAGEVNRGPGGREVALAVTKLEEAYLWLSRVTDEK